MRHCALRAVRFLMALLSFAAVRSEATAQDPPAGADPAVLFEESTFAAVGVNLDRARPAVLSAWVKEQLSAVQPARLEPGRVAEVFKELDGIASRAEAERAALLAAGATDLWLAFSWRGFPDRGIVAAVWTRQERDAAAIAAWVRRSLPDLGEASAEAPGLLIFGDAAGIAGLPCADAERLARARAALAAATHQELACAALVLPSDATRKAFEELASDARVPGSEASASPLIRNVRAATLGVRLEPAPSLTLRLDAPDQAGAAEVSGVLDAWLAALAASEPARGAVPEIGELVAMLRPTTQAGSSVVAVDAQALGRATGTLAPAMLGARQAANAMAEARKLRAVAMSCVVFEQNANRWPENLGELLKDGYVTEEMTRDAAGRTLVYLRPEKDAMSRQPERTVIAHQAFDAWPEPGIWTAFVDGHVELIESQERFRSFRPFAP